MTATETTRCPSRARGNLKRTLRRSRQPTIACLYVISGKLLPRRLRHRCDFASSEHCAREVGSPCYDCRMQNACRFPAPTPGGALHGLDQEGRRSRGKACSRRGLMKGVGGDVRCTGPCFQDFRRPLDPAPSTSQPYSQHHGRCIYSQGDKASEEEEKKTSFLLADLIFLLIVRRRLELG